MLTVSPNRALVRVQNQIVPIRAKRGTVAGNQRYPALRWCASRASLLLLLVASRFFFPRADD